MLVSPREQAADARVLRENRPRCRGTKSSREMLGGHGLGRQLVQLWTLPRIISRFSFSGEAIITPKVCWWLPTGVDCTTPT